eukprot:CAMPEP_0185846480 /NCGR_PEP_ID=MMETSP1354-20130828/2092_1 /TAXON_ID=708628 /ORGANISM="Erythrolobus madagascarensis, Strain CCMP3276" /LENGTH=446 /DNA_ID=CAMNT_0028546611 /DNA_START=49 /DNA_END=1389 /DNA_ORIENTATION=+
MANCWSESGAGAMDSKKLSGRIHKPEAQSGCVLPKRRLIRVNTLIQLNSDHLPPECAGSGHGDADDNVGAAAEQLRRLRPSLEEKLIRASALSPRAVSHSIGRERAKLREECQNALHAEKEQELLKKVSRLQQLQKESVHRSESAERFVNNTSPARTSARDPLVVPQEMEEQQRNEHNELLILLDFDDTLFPTSHMIRTGLVRSLPGTHGWDIVQACSVSPKVRHELREAQVRAVQLIMNLQKLGTVVVVTNAALSWVQSALAHFAPILNQYFQLEQIRIISARSSSTPQLPKSVHSSSSQRSKGGAILKSPRAAAREQSTVDIAHTQALVEHILNGSDNHKRSDQLKLTGKAAVFRQELTSAGERYSRVVVVGDTEADLTAARAAFCPFRAVQCTLVKLAERPSTAQLTAELKYLSDHATTLAALRPDALELVLQLAPQSPNQLV